MIKDQNFNLALVGSGKYTMVYRMEVDPVHKIAIKVLKPELSNNKFFQAHLIREGQAAQQLNDPNVRKVFEIVEDEVDHTIQLVMEYIDGYNLEEYIQNFGNIPEKQIIQWCRQIMPTLANAHKKGVVHGLLSPKNLLITPRGDLKITDFKGALFESELFPEDEDPDDILYLSPEQIQHVGKVGSATDIYTFGVTLYSLLTGKDPYKVANSGIDEIRIRILNDPLPFIDSYSFQMNEIVQIATAKNQTDRYPDFESMLEAITGEKRMVTQSEGKPILPSPDKDAQVESKSVTHPDSDNAKEQTHKKQDENEGVTNISIAENEKIHIESPIHSLERVEKIAASTVSKQDHTHVVTPLIVDDINTGEEDKEVDQAELDARARAIWDKIEAVRHEKPNPKVDKVEVVSTSNIDASQLGQQKNKGEETLNEKKSGDKIKEESKVNPKVEDSKSKASRDKNSKTDPTNDTGSAVTDELESKPVSSFISVDIPTITKPKPETQNEPQSKESGNKKHDQKPSTQKETATPEKVKSEQVSKSEDKLKSTDVEKVNPVQADDSHFDMQENAGEDSSRSRNRWLIPLMIIVLASGIGYWWMQKKDEPKIVEELPVVHDQATDTPMNNQKDSTFSSAVPINADSLAANDTSITSLEELDRLKMKQERQMAALKAKREAEQKRKEEEAKKAMVNTSDIELLGKYINGIAPFRWKGKVGFVDDANKVLISPKYDDILTYSDGLAPVRLNGLWGFVNTSGREILKPQFEEIFGFSRGLAGVKKKGKWGFINSIGKVVTPLKYDLVTDYSEGMAGVRKDGKWGFVNLSGIEVIQCRYHNAWSFTDGLAGVENNGEWGFINKAGKVVVPLDYSQVNNFSNGLACVMKNGRYGYIDNDGNVVIPFNYEAAKPFSGGTARVFSNGKWIYINKSGKCVRNCN